MRKKRTKAGKSGAIRSPWKHSAHDLDKVELTSRPYPADTFAPRVGGAMTSSVGMLLTTEQNNKQQGNDKNRNRKTRLTVCNVFVGLLLSWDNFVRIH